MTFPLATFYDAIDDTRIDALRRLMPHYSSWRDQSQALNLAVGKGMVEAVRLLAPRSDVLQHDGQILKTAVFMGKPEVVAALMPFFKDHLKPVEAAQEQAIKEHDLAVVQTIWAEAPDHARPDLQRESLRASRNDTEEDVRFYQRLAPLVDPEVATPYFEQVLRELAAHLPPISLGQILDPLAALVPQSLADTALLQLGRDAMPVWFRQWEGRQLLAVDTPGLESTEPLRRL